MMVLPLVLAVGSQAYDGAPHGIYLQVAMLMMVLPWY